MVLVIFHGPDRLRKPYCIRRPKRGFCSSHLEIRRRTRVFYIFLELEGLGRNRQENMRGKASIGQ